MNSSSVIIVVFLLSAFVNGIYNLTLNYADLVVIGAHCPDHRDSCRDYSNDADRTCKCDSACQHYNDCCIDAPSGTLDRGTFPSNRLACMAFGQHSNEGVYAVTRCNDNWRESLEVREKCEGPMNFSDPLMAAPVTSVAESVTYRSRYCTECNYANDPLLMTFQIMASCKGLEDLTDEEIFADITYDRNVDTWGVNRLNTYGNASEFIGCKIVFDVPDYIKDNERFCAPKVVSSCTPDWTENDLRDACSQYMAVVYDSNQIAYRNTYCALCNNRTVDQVTCWNDVVTRKRPMSFALLLDVNQSDGDQVGMRRVPTPECPSNHKYDPFFKKCRQLFCALPGYVVQNGVCVQGSG